MKRAYGGVPVAMTHQWGGRPSSCRLCKQKKRRCDHNQPCSNCSLRKLVCEYERESPSQTTQIPGDRSPQRIRLQEPSVTNSRADFRELRHGTLTGNATPFSIRLTRFSLHSDLVSNNESPANTSYLAGYLPPISEARILLNHFHVTTQTTIGILHMPSTRDLMENTYQNLLNGELPDMPTLLLLLTIFAAAALGSNPDLLPQLNATQEQAILAQRAYLHVCRTILDSSCQIPLSTTALAAVAMLALLIANEDGWPIEAHLLRARCLWMARSMEIHRLDTPKNRQGRKLKGYNMIDLEVQRRVWWNMVATDWLMAFSGTVHDGIYTIHSEHMNVDYPSNADDRSILPSETHDLPLSEPTSMSAFIYRLKLAEICREVVDAMPSAMLEGEEPNYDTILALDKRFQKHQDNLPTFFRVDPQSIQQSQSTCAERPYIAWQRLAVNLSIWTRRCRLHRPYHLEGITNPKYAYSRDVCVRSAHTVLDLRQLMDEACAPVGLKPARLWIVVQHVFLAALTLAIDVSFTANSADADARKTKVLAAYQTLESSVEESPALRDLLHKNLRTLMSTLERRQSFDVTLPSNLRSSAGGPTTTGQMNDTGGSLVDAAVQGDTIGQNIVNEAGPWDENWEQLWTEFLEVAPDLDFLQWDVLLEGTDGFFTALE